ncbi:MAG: putative metal-dependent HD superfamily phosphohydrolase [Planctomycetota bacterium]|jgi:predicted metal-dependent HD superfamily phosphohydrolase
MMNDEQRWSHAWQQLGASPRGGLLASVQAGYAEEQRAYHTLQHLEECFAALEPAAHLAERIAEVELALWFHDAIYETKGSGSEEQSARWAEKELLAGGASAEVASRVAGLVLATKHDAVPEGADAQLLVDVDLSILGADPVRFDEYEQQVRREYGWVPVVLFRSNRAKLLASLLERPSLYSTSWFAERLEQRARKNLARSLAQLT